MPDLTTVEQFREWLNDDDNIAAMTVAVQEVNRIYLEGTSDRPPVGILPPISAGALTFLASENNPEFDSRYLGRWEIGIDLAEGQDFTPTED